MEFGPSGARIVGQFAATTGLGNFGILHWYSAFLSEPDWGQSWRLMKAVGFFNCSQAANKTGSGDIHAHTRGIAYLNIIVLWLIT